jgi:hypothetical protein
VARPRLSDRSAGTCTLAEIHAEHGQVPRSTLRAHLASAAIGEWLPPGTRRIVVLYDATKVDALLAHPPARRPTTAHAKPRRRRDADAAILRGLPVGWISLGDLARTVARDPAKVRRALDAHARAAVSLRRQLGAGIVDAFAALFEGVGLDPGSLHAVRASRRIVHGRMQCTFEEARALVLLHAGNHQPLASNLVDVWCAAASRRWAPLAADDSDRALLYEDARARVDGAVQQVSRRAAADAVGALVLEAFGAAWRPCDWRIALRRADAEISPLVEAWRSGESASTLRTIVARARRSTGDVMETARIDAIVAALVAAPLVDTPVWRSALEATGARRWAVAVEEILGANDIHTTRVRLTWLRREILFELVPHVTAAWVSARRLKRWPDFFVVCEAALRKLALKDSELGGEVIDRVLGDLATRHW